MLPASLQTVMEWRGRSGSGQGGRGARPGGVVTIFSGGAGQAQVTGAGGHGLGEW